MKATTKLRQMLASDGIYLAPGAFDGLTARLEDLAGNNLRGSFERRANDDYASALSIVNRTFTVN